MRPFIATALVAFAIFAIAASPNVVRGAEPPSIHLPIEVRGKPGELLPIVARADGQVEWTVVDAGLSLVPANVLKDSKATYAFGVLPGRYRLVAWTAKGDVPSLAAWCVVIIDPSNPSPPGPVPPPVPPGPGPFPPPVPPPPPPPVDPLTQKMQAAYTADSAPAPLKQSQRALLIGLYEAMADHTRTDKTLRTCGELRGDLEKTAKLMILPSALIGVRQVIADELAVAIGDNIATPLDDLLRARAADAFARVADALERVK